MSQTLNIISIGSAVLCTAHPCAQHTDTDHATCGICGNRLHLMHRVGAMQLMTISLSALLLLWDITRVVMLFYKPNAK